MDLDKLPAWGEDGGIHVVIEAPRGCGVKLKFDPSLGAFTYGRALPLGLSYPYDWGFVPGTEAQDGDPLDALVIADVPTYPGVVVPCRILGAVLVEQKKSKGKGRERNDRIVAVPLEAERFAEIDKPGELPGRMREEIEQFFLSTTFFTQKEARVLGWKGPKYGTKLVRQAARGSSKKGKS